MTQACPSAQLQNRLQTFPVRNWPPKNLINQVFFLSGHYPVKQEASFSSHPHWKCINHWHSLGILLGKLKFPLWNPVENSLLLDRTPRRAGPPVLSSSEPSPSAFVVTVLPPSVHANLCSQAAPFQSTCKYKTPLKLTLVPSLSVLRASKGMQVKKEDICSGRERWRGHKPSSGWTLWETWSHHGDRHLQNPGLGTASPWLSSVSLPSELLHSALRAPPVTANRPFMYIFSYRNGNKSKTNMGLLTYVCCLIAKAAEKKSVFLLVAFSFYAFWKISPWQENWKWHKNVKLNNETEKKMQRQRQVSCFIYTNIDYTRLKERGTLAGEPAYSLQAKISKINV